MGFRLDQKEKQIFSHKANPQRVRMPICNALSSLDKISSVNFSEFWLKIPSTLTGAQSHARKCRVTTIFLARQMSNYSLINHFAVFLSRLTFYLRNFDLTSSQANFCFITDCLSFFSFVFKIGQTFVLPTHFPICTGPDVSKPITCSGVSCDSGISASLINILLYLL